jgi:tetratricopeptide (TPR) repeat protein
LALACISPEREFDDAIKILQPYLDRVLETNRESPAIIAVEEIVKIDPYHIGALKKLQQIYTYLKDKNSLVRILSLLSKAYEQDKDYKLAIDIVEQLIGLEPDKLAHKNRLEQLYEISGGAAMFENDSATVEEMDLPDSIEFSLQDEVNGEGLDPQVHRKSG